jgi:dienelactone hydrolase
MQRGAGVADPTIEERDGARIRDIEVAGAAAYLVEPLEGGRGPAVLFLHWLDTEAPDGNRTQFVDEAVGLARDRGVVSLLPQGQFPWEGPPTDADADIARIRAEVERHRAAVDLLAARPDVDPARIGLVGHDYGGMHGVLLAADDPRIAAGIFIAMTPRWGDWNLAFFPIAGDRFDYLRALGPFDPVTRIGELAPRPVWLQFAKNDFYIAPMSWYELHRSAGDPKQLHAYENVDHGVRDPEARADRERFLGTALGWAADG